MTSRIASIERLLELGGPDVAEVAVEALRVVPVDPAEGGEFEVLDRRSSTVRVGRVRGRVRTCSSRSRSQLSERVILAVADGPDRGCGADLGEAFPVADRGELTTGMAVATQVVVAGAAAPAGHLDGVEDVSVRT